jgi:hypothetical protein
MNVYIFASIETKFDNNNYQELNILKKMRVYLPDGGSGFAVSHGNQR